MYEKHRIRKYGFHGTSHRFVSLTAAELLGENIGNLKLISCHLGNGASVAAIRYGKCIDTSMGLTPLAGLEMGTRCGDIDPAIIPFLCDKGYTVDQVNTMMNKESGVLGVSGVSSDFRDVEAAAEAGNERAKLALDIFIYGIIFTAGLGENSSKDRAAVCSGLKYLGIQLDEEKNSKRGEALVISTPDSRTKVMVIPTNEELMIARDTVELVG